jgi:hypothetical protein
MRQAAMTNGDDIDNVLSPASRSARYDRSQTASCSLAVMPNIPLLEDLPQTRAWLMTLLLEVFPQSTISEADRARSDHRDALRPRADRSRPARRFGHRSGRRPARVAAIARRVLAHFATRTRRHVRPNDAVPVLLTGREEEVLLRIAKGFTLNWLRVSPGVGPWPAR